MPASPKFAQELLRNKCYMEGANNVHDCILHALFIVPEKVIL